MRILIFILMFSASAMAQEESTQEREPSATDWQNVTPEEAVQVEQIKQPGQEVQHDSYDGDAPDYTAPGF